MVAIKSAALIVNPHSGRAWNRATPDEIGSLLSSAGIKSSIALVRRGESAAVLARDAVRQGFETIVACGGDGTVSAVASAVTGTEAALGIIPGGTLNHFAKDLHIPLDMEAAAQVISRGKIEKVDAGEVNGKCFVNNSSLGIYPSIVITRERRRRMGGNKWVALGLAILRVVRRYPFVDVRISAKGECIAERTPFVFVGNNEYEISGLNIGSRRSLNSGRLYLYVPAPVSRAGLVALAISALLGRADKGRRLQVFSVDEAWIETRRRRVHVAKDGEVLHLNAPLHYRARPGDLKVIVP